MNPRPHDAARPKGSIAAEEPVGNSPERAAAAPDGPAAPAAEPSRASRLARHLPRAGLLIFLLAILVVFRGVLLPFLLGVFCAYLIYPVVSRLERITVSRWRPPRWLCVISVYAVMFTAGWWGIPPLMSNFAEQVRTLASDVPSHFSTVQGFRKDLDAWIASKLEVTYLSDLAAREIYDHVDALADGTIEPAPEEAGISGVLPPTPPADAVDAPADPAPAPVTIVQLVAINLNLGERGGESGAGAAVVHPSEIPDEGSRDAEAGSSGGEDEADSTGEGGLAGATVAAERRFDEACGDAFKTELRETINAELRRPGPGKGVPARVEREIVPALAKKHLELPEGDPQLAVFARNAGLRVATAISQEDYAGVFNNYVTAGLDTARRWTQEQITGLTGLVTGLATGIFDFFMVLMLTAFFLVFFPRIRDYVRDLVAPQYRVHYGKILKRIDVRLSGAIRGQVIICMVNAVLTFPGLWLIGTQTQATNLASYSVILSLLAGVLSLIPIFGVILSTVPMVILALTQGSWAAALLVIGWISMIHAIEAYLLNPNILGHSASMNPIIVVFALLAGKHFGGLIGALLAVPIASVVVSLFGYYRRLVAEDYAEEQGVAAPADAWGD